MNTLSKVAVGGVAVCAVAVGGFFVFDHQVRNTFEKSFANINSDTPLIRSMTYEALDIDYLADSIVLHNSRIEYDVAEVMNTQVQLEGAEYSGSIAQEQNQIMANGLWNMISGKNIIPLLSIDQGTVTGNIQAKVPQTLPTEDGPQTVTIIQDVAVSGSFEDGKIEGMSWGNSDEVSAISPFGVNIQYLEAKNYDFDMAFKVGSDATVQAPAKKEAFSIKFQIARVIGEGIEPLQVKTMRYEGIDFTVDLPDEPSKKFTASIDAMGIRDMVTKNDVPLKMSYYIDGFELDPKIVTDPQVKGLMGAFGIDELKFSFQLAYDYNEDTRALKLSPISFGAKQAGQLELGFNLQGLPSPEVLKEFEKIAAMRDDQSADSLIVQKRSKELFEKHFNDISLSSISVGYEDDGTLKKVLAMQAMQSNADAAQMAQALSNQGAMVIMQTHGAEVAEDAQKKLARFLEDPQAIKVKLSTETPILLKELAEAFKVSGPQALNQFELSIESGNGL